MIPIRRLDTRFLLASAVLVATTVACGVWSGLTFARLSAVVDDTLRESQQTIDLAAVLATTLEREDDALLLALGGDVAKARSEGPADLRRPPTRCRRSWRFCLCVRVTGSSRLPGCRRPGALAGRSKR